MLICSKSYNKLYSSHEHKEKKRCPYCGDLNTKKKGFISSSYLSSRGVIHRKLQRFICKTCKKNFTTNGIGQRKRVGVQIRNKAVKDYVLSKNSLSEVSDRYQVSRTSILNWLNSVAQHYPSLQELSPQIAWSGILQLDGKEIKLKGVRKVLFVATDAIIKIPICYSIVDREDST